jgi:REP element-mobilizing transposase RayT
MHTAMRAHQWTVDLNALVVMPDHGHMVLVPKIDTPKLELEVFSLAQITKGIKGTSAHLINL